MSYTETQASKKYPDVDRGETLYLSEDLHEAEFAPTRQAATIAKRHALTIVSRPSPGCRYLHAELHPIITSYQVMTISHQPVSPAVLSNTKRLHNVG